jgi:dTMP kinase
LDDDTKDTPLAGGSAPDGGTPAIDPPAGEEPSTQVSLELSAYRKVFRDRDFMALWVGQGISSMGDWVIVGVLLDMVNRMGGTTGLFIMMTFRFLPAFLFGLLAGAVVDRLERKTLMILCEISRAVLVVILAFANSLAMICILVFSIECFTLLFGPAKDSSIPDLVGKDEVMTANSMMSTSTYLTMALGTFLATLILGLAALIHSFPLVSNITSLQNFQHTFAFILDALTFLISAALIFTIAFPRRFAGKRPEIRANQIWTDFKDGLSFMRSNPLTRSILGVMIIGFIGGGSLYILGAPFAQQALNSVGSKFTLILTFLLVGVVVGAALAPWLNRYFPVSKWFGRAVVGFGLAMLAFAWIDFYPLSLGVIFIGGFFLGYLLVTAYTLLHQNLDEAIRGRVFAAFQTIMRTCLLISMGIFAGISSLFSLWIPWKPEKPVYKSLNLGLIHKSIYPSMLAIMVGAAIVIVGGIIAIRSLRRYFRIIEEQAAKDLDVQLPKVEPGFVFIPPEKAPDEGGETGEGTPAST